MERKLKKTGSMNLKYCFTVILTCLFSTAFGQRFYAEVNKQKLGVNDRLEYAIVLEGITKGSYTPPDFSKDFYVVSGPNQSQQTTNINGVSSSEIKISYVLKPRNLGLVNIAPASIDIDGKLLKSSAFNIQVVNQTEAQKAAVKAAEQDLFIKAIVSDRDVYVGEAITVSFKLYSAVDLGRGNEPISNPDFNGFWSKNLKANNSWKRENYNGRTYQTAIISQYLLIPQSVGKQTIEPLYWKFAVRKKSNNNRRDPFGGFFNSYSEESREISSKAIAVTVKGLPAKGKPEDFSGAVGNFNLNLSVNKRQVKANEGLDFKIKLSGKGNLVLVTLPKPDFPTDFDVYDPKPTNRIQSSMAGMSGSKEINILAIPRIKGSYQIPGLNFSFFNPKAGKYQSIKTSDLNLDVLNGGSGSDVQVYSGANKTELEVKNRDIRFIKTTTDLVPAEDQGSKTLHYLLMLLLGPVLVLIAFILRKKQVSESGRPIHQQSSKVRKLAKKQLKSAELALKTNDKDLYYQKLYDCLNDYLSRKLNIDRAVLTKETIKQGLLVKGLENATWEKVNAVLETCEMARFAPADTDIHDMHNEVIQLIETIESKK
ncbi:MAG: hypothetical protein ACI8ZO_000517 [Flavobacteriales bacterium]